MSHVAEGKTKHSRGKTRQRNKQVLCSCARRWDCICPTGKKSPRKEKRR
jgi:hypothetical protein